VLTSGLSGIVDVDVASLSAARLAGASVPMETAAIAVLTAIAVNAVARVAAAFALGPLRYARPFCLATASAIVTGGAALMAQRLWEL
jgi:uncharacterized membrane protein (DUF4010 family)